MLKENWKFVSRAERIGDFIILVAVFFLSYYLRHWLVQLDQYYQWGLPFAGPRLLPIKRYMIVLIVGALSYISILQAMGAYGSMRLSSFWQLLRTFGVTALIAFFILSSTLYLTKNESISRSFLILFCLISIFALTFQRYLVLGFLRYFRRKGFNFRNLIIFGLGKQTVELVKEIACRPEIGIRIRGFADLREQKNFSKEDLVKFKKDLRAAGCNNIGKIHFGVNKLENILKEYAIDEVIFTDVVQTLPEVEEAILICTEQGVRTTIAADLFSIGMVKSGISYFGNFPLIHYQTPPGDGNDLIIKRMLDMVLSMLLLIFLIPLFALISIAIKLEGRGPILYVQKRVGLNGRLFNFLKFRSMKVGADGQLEKLKEKNEMKGPAFKMKNDPRITRVGAYLRRFSLDELPQLWNVFIGDMSLVGPRPPVPGEVRIYERRYRRRLSMRPGMTCTWQVSGRSNIKDFETWIKLDLDYIDHWSLSQDFKLLFRTIPAVIFGTGAR